jgi:hypothetical protein
MCSPLQAHWGVGATPTFSGSLFIYSSHGGVPLSPSGAFLTTTITSFTHSKVAGQGLPLLPSLVACLFTVGMKKHPSSTLQSSGGPALFATSFFFFQLLVYYILFYFFPGEAQSVQAPMLVIPGSTMYHLFAHLVVSQAG